MAVPSTILGILDRVAAGREAQLAAFASGDDFWTRVDGAADETYENRVKGSDITVLDTALLFGGSWAPAAHKKLFTLHDTYFNSDLSIAATPRLGTWLASQGWRAPYYAALAHEDAMGSALAAAQVFGPGIKPANEANPTSAGMHYFGLFTATSTWAASAGALASTIGPCGVLAVNMSAAQTVGGTFRCTWGSGGSDYKDLALSLSGAAQYTQTILGRQAIASGAAAGQAVVNVAATAQFIAGMQVLVWESDSLQEVGTIQTVTTNTSLTLTSNLVHTFTTSGYVIPLFRNAAYQSSGSGTGAVRLYALPDRTIAV